MRPSVVVVGSAVPGREYKPPIKDLKVVPSACEAIGRELALAGCDLVVFSSSEDFIEKNVVRGYLSALKPKDPAVVTVRSPFEHPADFGVPAHMQHVVRVEPDPSDEWEMSYYRAIFEADGLVVVGGGRASRIAGVLAVAQRKPIVALAAFGGGALSAWRHLDRHSDDVSQEDVNLMASPWTDDSAKRLVQCLGKQRAQQQEATRAEQRNQARARRARTVNGLLATAAIILAALTIILGFGTSTTSTAVSYLIAGPLLTAMAGALINDAMSDEPNVAWSTARGLGAGVLAATLYVGSQTLTNAETLNADGARRLTWFLVPIGLVAGYTVDRLFAKLRDVDALSDKPFPQP